MVNMANPMRIITRKGLLNKIRAAVDDSAAFVALRHVVYDYYYAEDNYSLSDDVVLEQVFGQLASYLTDEEVFGDASKNERLQNLYRVLGQDFSLETAIFVIHQEKIVELAKRLQDHKISSLIHEEQIRKLSPIAFSIEKLSSMTQQGC